VGVVDHSLEVVVVGEVGNQMEVVVVGEDIHWVEVGTVQGRLVGVGSLGVGVVEGVDILQVAAVVAEGIHWAVAEVVPKQEWQPSQPEARA
jgi:hypothetical protein